MSNTFILWFIALFYIEEHLASKENPYLKAVSENYLAQNTAHGYLEVRPGAHLFYWLYHADGTTKDASQKPLIIWIQGGPGYAASTVGNFFEFGPLTMDFKPRNHTWVKGRNVLLIDHPIGTGFSYVTSRDLYAKTDYGMAMDLAEAIKGFYRKHRMFQTTPMYLISQSYGGKICPFLADILNEDIKHNNLIMNFKGIAIGSGFIDPHGSMVEAINLFYQMGYADRVTFLKCKQLLHQVQTLVKNYDYARAFKLIESVYTILMHEEFRNLNNIFLPSRLQELTNFSSSVNEFIKPTLRVNQSIDYSFASNTVYDALEYPFIRTTFHFLEKILTNTTLKVVVYNGNLDALTPVADASNWVHELKWPHQKKFNDAKRLRIRGINNGYYKVMEQLSFWSVFRAGHWVPDDNPKAMEHILDYLLANEKR